MFRLKLTTEDPIFKVVGNAFKFFILSTETGPLAALSSADETKRNDCFEIQPFRGKMHKKSLDMNTKIRMAISNNAKTNRKKRQRLKQLSSPKKHVIIPPRDPTYISPASLKAIVTKRIKYLSQPKQYVIPKGNIIGTVSKKALKYNATERLTLLAHHKEFKGLMPQKIPSHISQTVLNAIASPRVIFLSQPKEYSIPRDTSTKLFSKKERLDQIDDSRKRYNYKSNEDPIDYDDEHLSVRLLELALPKKYKPQLTNDFLVKRSALVYEATSRITELSQPKPVKYPDWILNKKKKK